MGLEERIYGNFNHCDPIAVALHREVPRMRFGKHTSFLEAIVAKLPNRNVYIGKVEIAVGIDAYDKVPAIRERRRGFGSLFFGLFDPVLYKLGWGLEMIKDTEVKKAVKLADKEHPYEYTARMPLGTPIGRRKA